MRKGTTGSIAKVKVVLCDAERASAASIDVIRERMVEIVLNGRPLVRIACTGEHLEELAAGFVRSEGIVQGREDILDLRVTAGGGRVEIRTAAGRGRGVRGRTAGRAIASSGARGTAVDDDAGAGVRKRFVGGPVLTPQNVLRLMSGLLRSARLHDATRGTHCSALATPQRIVVSREDIGRHNTLDMLSGHVLLEGLSPDDKVVLTTGRVSAEIVHKIGIMGVPVIISHSAPTTRAVELAAASGVTLVGYVRNGRMRIYAGPDRIRF